MTKDRDMKREVQRRIDFIDLRLQTEANGLRRRSWAQERSALKALLSRSDRVQGLIIAMELIATAARKGDIQTITRVADDALMRTSEEQQR